MMVTREAMPAREAMRDNRGAVAGDLFLSHRANSDSLMVIVGQPDYNRRVLLHLPQNRTPPGWPPKAFLAGIRSKLMRRVITVPILAQVCRIESPQSTVLSGQFALGEVRS